MLPVYFPFATEALISRCKTIVLDAPLSQSAMIFFHQAGCQSKAIREIPKSRWFRVTHKQDQFSEPPGVSGIRTIRSPRSCLSRELLYFHLQLTFVAEGHSLSSRDPCNSWTVIYIRIPLLCQRIALERFFLRGLVTRYESAAIRWLIAIQAP